MNLITKGQNIHIIIFFITLLFSQIHDQVICQHFCDRLVAHTEQDGPVELNQDSPKFLLKKSMINVFSHLPQQVAFWKGLSRGFLHEKKKKITGLGRFINVFQLQESHPDWKFAKGHALAFCQCFAVGKHYVEGLPLLQ